MTRIQFQEWSAPDQFGDREDMGVHFYSMPDAQRIIDNGGILEPCSVVAGIVDSDYAVRKLFGEE